MELTQETVQKIHRLLANPRLVSTEDVSLLNAFSASYPYFQPAYLLAAKVAFIEDENQPSLLTKASIYNNGVLLHQLIYQPESLKQTDDFNVVNYQRAENKPPLTIEEYAHEGEKETSFEEPEEATIKPTQSTPAFTLDDIEDALLTAPLEEKTAAQSLASSDFFAFENSLADTNAEVKLPPLENEPQNHKTPPVISKYNDNELPYTFLWWLAKTRKEYAHFFKPYITQKPANSQPTPVQGQLQHQYVEHIFHLQGPFVKEDSANASLASHKGHDIIERFIQNDPHIKALNPNQIDNENKARKSTEDNYDLVSETLAEIYIEQMLFNKAIDTYRKLSLKFPEKSRYFANLIQSLEKKI